MIVKRNVTKKDKKNPEDKPSSGHHMMLIKLYYSVGWFYCVFSLYKIIKWRFTLIKNTLHTTNLLVAEDDVALCCCTHTTTKLRRKVLKLKIVSSLWLLPSLRAINKNNRTQRPYETHFITLWKRNGSVREGKIRKKESEQANKHNSLARE